MQVITTEVYWLVMNLIGSECNVSHLCQKANLHFTSSISSSSLKEFENLPFSETNQPAFKDMLFCNPLIASETDQI